MSSANNKIIDKCILVLDRVTHSRQCRRVDQESDFILHSHRMGSTSKIICWESHARR